MQDKVYITGVASDDDDILSIRRQVQVYSLEERKWSTVPRDPIVKPAPNYNAPIAIIDDHITLIGGRDATSGIITNALCSWFEEEREWKQILPPMPTRRLESGVCHHDNFLLVSGGIEIEPTVLNTVDVYNFNTKSWITPKALELPIALRSHHLVFFEDDIYLMAGATTYPTNSKDGEEQFNRHAWRARWSDVKDVIAQGAESKPVNLWTPIPGPPALRSTVVSCRPINRPHTLIAIGGILDGSHQKGIYKFIDNQWVTVGNMSVGRYRHAAVPVGDFGAALFIAGGFLYSKPTGDEAIVKSASAELVLL